MKANLLAKNALANEPIKVDEALINDMLSELIIGASCSQMMPLFRATSNEIWVKNGDIIDAAKQKGKIRFMGRLLQGGILDSEKGLYLCPSKHFSYALNGSKLIINALCEKQSFTVINFDKKRADFGIVLASKPGKEIALVINLARSMKDYILALKEIALYLGSHLFKDNEIYTKASLVGFCHYTANDFGTFTQTKSLANAINSLNAREVPTQMINYALVLAMRNFTKDNGLSKELYLITDGEAVDMANQSDMLYLTQNLNRNIVKNSGGSKANSVKIHCFSLGGDFVYLKNLAGQTSGQYFEPKSILELKKGLLSLVNGGAWIDPKEYGNVIVPSKTHKMFDPDDPDNPPLGLSS